MTVTASRIDGGDQGRKEHYVSVWDEDCNTMGSSKYGHGPLTRAGRLIRWKKLPYLTLVVLSKVQILLVHVELSASVVLMIRLKSHR